MLATETAIVTSYSDETVGPFVILKTLDESNVKVPISLIKNAAGIVGYIDGELAKKDLGAISTQAPSDETLLEVKVPHATSWILCHVLTFLKNHPDTSSYVAETYEVNKKLDTAILDLANEDLPQILLASDLFDLPELGHIASEAIAERLNAAASEGTVRSR
jgi:hypothetical protein